MAGAPKLWGWAVVRGELDDLFADLAETMLRCANDAVAARGEFHLALSGGSTPEPFFVRLVTDPRYRAVPWERTHIWQVDERRVPESDERSNYRLIRETLVDHVPIRRRGVHPMPATAVDADAAYEQTLRELVPEQRLDFVLLGMGDDGHTASLFPHSPAVDEQQRLVTINAGPQVTPPERLTLTFPALNRARRIAVLVTGGRKAAMLRQVSDHRATRGRSPRELPITAVGDDAHVAEQVMWFLDEPAAGIAPVEAIDLQ